MGYGHAYAASYGHAHMPKAWRIALLSAALLATLAIAVPVHRLPWPVTCNQAAPPWLPALVQWAKSQSQPGFQLALQFPNNQQPPLECSAGFAGPAWWHGLLRSSHTLRYASLSKVMTSAAVLQAMHEGRWHTDDTLVQQLPQSGPWADPRIAQMTLGQLLSHTAGFDRTRTPDPMFAAQPWCPNHLTALRTLKLDHAPGTHYAYANVGYCLLGAALQARTGQTLPAQFAQQWWGPWGLRSITAVERGKWLPHEPLPHFATGESAEQLLHINYEALRSSGGWAGTAADYNRWLHTVLSTPYGAALLGNPRDCAVQTWRHCHGWAFYQYQTQSHRPAMWWRDGSLPGVTGFAAHVATGETVTYLAHGRNIDWIPDSDALGQFFYRVLAP